VLEFTPEPISVVITAVAAFVVAIGGKALKQGYDSGKSANPEDRGRMATEANTAALMAMAEQFRHNNSLFVAMTNRVDNMGGHVKDSNQKLDLIHTELVRGNAQNRRS
jgi:hypothetical protein